MTGTQRLLVAGALLLDALLWYPEWAAPAAVLLAITLLTVGLPPRTQPTPPVIRAIPRRRPRRWRFGFGLGLSHWGPIPFITLYRRY
jgi:hypothetical protein